MIFMPSRLKRYQTEGDGHFITFSCYHRLPFLDNDPARICFEKTLEEVRKRHRFYLYGYVLMPEHVHLLLSEPRIHSLDTTLSVLKRETSRLLKEDKKQFWQLRYYDFNVFTEKKLVEKLRYIHRNPVTRGLVEKPEDWPWSSFQCYLTGVRGRVEIQPYWQLSDPTHDPTHAR